jgi:hypothetical protein
MGFSSREKWMARVATYEQIAIREGTKAAKAYLDRFGKNLARFLKASVELEEERELAEEEEAVNGSFEEEDDDVESDES